MGGLRVRAGMIRVGSSRAGYHVRSDVPALPQRRARRVARRRRALAPRRSVGRRVGRGKRTARRARAARGRQQARAAAQWTSDERHPDGGPALPHERRGAEARRAAGEAAAGDGHQTARALPAISQHARISHQGLLAGGRQHDRDGGGQGKSKQGQHRQHPQLQCRRGRQAQPSEPGARSPQTKSFKPPPHAAAQVQVPTEPLAELSPCAQFWTRLSSTFGNNFFVRDNGEDVAILRAVCAIADANARSR
jgi:hypothetical protein